MMNERFSIDNTADLFLKKNILHTSSHPTIVYDIIMY